jgi:acetyl esterase/lipase
MKRKFVLPLIVMLALALLAGCGAPTATGGAQATAGAVATESALEPATKTPAETAAGIAAETAAETATEANSSEGATVAAVTETVTDDLAGVAVEASPAGGSYSLAFPVDDYTLVTETVTTSVGTHEVTYRLYEHIPYVAKPVDVAYQSMDVKVPVTVDGQAVDATNAPILFVIGVGGYMSDRDANDGGAGGMMGGAPGGMPPGAAAGAALSGTLPAGANAGGPPAGMMGGMGNDTGISHNADLALAAGYVVAEPGARGRDNQAEDGTYYGKAPAAIVDLKSAVRYLHYNDAVMPGNAEWIVSTGVSAGGALSALLGASGDSDLYAAYFAELGAADASDRIFASADFCPITDLEHADMAYEWEWGTTPLNGELVDQAVSQPLAAAFDDYQASLQLEGENGYGLLIAGNYGDYLVQAYLAPSATQYLAALADEERDAYLAENPWITWDGSSASFRWADYVAHVGRMKDLPAFDALDLSAAENGLFGDATTAARHFTEFSVQTAGGDPSATLDADVQTLVELMNPMSFIANGCEGCAQYWWIRHGTADSNTALTVITNLALSLQAQGKDVNLSLYWDAGHGADEDPEAFIAWIGEITGYAR